MSDNYGLVRWETLHNIGEALREKLATNQLFYPSEMAGAINNISGGGMFAEPVVLSLMDFKANSYDNRYWDNSIIDMEVTNNIPYNQTGFVNYGDISWKGFSPDEVILYKYEGLQNRLLVNNVNFCGYTNNSLYTGDTNNIIYANGNLYEVQEYDWTISTSRGSLLYYGPNIYNNNNFCWFDLGYLNNIGTPYQNNNDLYVHKAGPILGLGVSNEWNEGQVSILDMRELFVYCNNLTNTYSGNYTTSMYNTYYYCYGLSTAKCGPRVTDMYNTYYSCGSLTQAAVGNNVARMYNTYAYCYNLQQAVIGKNTLLMDGAYYSCGNIRSIIGDASSLINGNNAFASCTNLQNTIPMPNLIYGMNMFTTCYNLKEFPYTPNLENGYNMYNCWQYESNSVFTTENVQNYLNNCPNLKDMSQMFNFGPNLDLTALNFPPNVISINYLLVNIGVGGWNDDMQEFHPYSTATDCEYPDSIRYICGTFYNSNTLLNAYCGNNVFSMNFAYNNCVNLINAACSDSVVYMDNTYRNCINLTHAACGNNVMFMNWTYGNCYNLTDAVCSDSVLSMDYTYYNCANLINAACGNNVSSMNGTYGNCFNLINAVCGDNVQYMESTYYNCINLKNTVIGNNVIYLNSTFYNCRSLTETAIIPDKVVNANHAYALCDNITDAIINIDAANLTTTGYGVINSLNTSLCGVFSGCSNLKNVTIDDNVPALYMTFSSCNNLETVNLPNNLQYMAYCFRLCYNLSGDFTIPDKVSNMYDAFNQCNKWNAIYINSNGINNFYYGSYRNAFLSNPRYEFNQTTSVIEYIPQVLVIGNYEFYKNFGNMSNNYCRFGNFIRSGWGFTNEVFDTPRQVIVNNITYNVVRATYNNTYNRYVYCCE